MQEVQAAAGVPGIEEDRLAAVDQRRQRARIVLMRDRGHHEHDEVGAGERLRHVRGHHRDRHQPLLHAARLDAAARAQRREAFRPARMQADREAAPA